MKKELDKYFKDWKPETDCVVVGSSPSLTWYNFGKYIDKFETVVRVNYCFTTDTDLSTGKKVDIWSTTNTDRPGWDCFSAINEETKEVWVRTPVTEEQLKGCGAFESFPVKNIKYISRKGNSDITFVHDGMIDITGTPTGILTINQDLNQFKKITIIGHTFYLETKDISIHLGQEKEDDNHEKARRGWAGDGWCMHNLNIIKDLIKDGRIILLNPFEYDNLAKLK